MEFLISDDDAIAAVDQDGLAARDGEREERDAAAGIDVATLTIEGYVLLPNGRVEKRTITLPIHVERAGAAVVNPEVRRELLLLEAAAAREEALEDRSTGAFEDGARKLRRVAEKMAPHAESDAVVRDELEDLREMAERFDEQQVSIADAKWMYQRAYSRSTSKEASMEPVREARAAARDKRRRSGRENI